MSAFSLSAADELVRRVVEEADAKKAAEPKGRLPVIFGVPQTAGGVWEGNGCLNSWKKGSMV